MPPVRVCGYPSGHPDRRPRGYRPARLLEVIEGRSKQAVKQWLAERNEPWRQGLQVVAMDGFTGFTTATTEELPDVVALWIPSTSCAWPGRPWMRPPARPRETRDESSPWRERGADHTGGMGLSPSA